MDRDSLNHPDRLIDDRGKHYPRHHMDHVKIVTKLPHPADLKLLKELNKYEAHSMQGQIPVVWNGAKDFMVYDRHGNEFIDFTSGICVTNVGHGNEEVMKAIENQVIGYSPLAHAYTFGTQIRLDFIKELVDTCYPNGKAFLVSAGTEATEVACKLMRIYSKKKVIISISGAMHGRTMLAEQLKGDNTWADFTNKVWHLPVPTDQDTFIEDMLVDYRNVAGFIIESYQGWSATFYPKKWIQDLIKFAKKNNIPVCFDEIQGGFGRTGKMFAYEHYDIERPDLICFGKGVSSSVPLSGVIGRTEIIDSVPVGSMSSTHSANPISCAAGLANIRYIKKHRLVDRARLLGIGMIHHLSNLNIKVEGHGLLCAIHTNDAQTADEIVMECFKKGLLVIRTHRESVKIAPPLTISEKALNEGLNIISQVIKER